MFASSRRLSSASSTKYSLQGLRQVYADLLNSHAEARASAGRPQPDSRREAQVETIRTISEIIIYGEQNSEQELIFDYFCEKNMLALLTDIMKFPGSDETVQIQILQTVAILVQNVRNETSLFYLLSNNYINEMITFDPLPTQGVMSDDLLSHLVSFLKTLSLRLDPRTVQFFIADSPSRSRGGARESAFPLYDRVLRFITQAN